MEVVQTTIKCLGIVGIFILPLLMVTLGYYFLNIINSGHPSDLTDFLSYIGRTLNIGFVYYSI